MKRVVCMMTALLYMALPVCARAGAASMPGYCPSLPYITPLLLEGGDVQVTQQYTIELAEYQITAQYALTNGTSQEKTVTVCVANAPVSAYNTELVMHLDGKALPISLHAISWNRVMDASFSMVENKHQIAGMHMGVRLEQWRLDAGQQMSLECLEGPLTLYEFNVNPDFAGTYIDFELSCDTERTKLIIAGAHLMEELNGEGPVSVMSDYDTGTFSVLVVGEDTFTYRQTSVEGHGLLDPSVCMSAGGWPWEEPPVFDVHRREQFDLTAFWRYAITSFVPDATVDGVVASLFEAEMKAALDQQWVVALGYHAVQGDSVERDAYLATVRFALQPGESRVLTVRQPFHYGYDRQSDQNRHEDFVFVDMDGLRTWDAEGETSFTVIAQGEGRRAEGILQATEEKNVFTGQTGGQDQNVYLGISYPYRESDSYIAMRLAMAGVILLVLALVVGLVVLIAKTVKRLLP